MLVRYFDPNRDDIVECNIASKQELENLWAEVRVMTTGRGAPALELERGDESSLVMAPVPVGGALIWIDSLGDSFHSVGSGTDDGALEFDYLGSHTEISEGCVVPDRQVVSAGVAYLDTGIPVIDAFNFEPD